MICKLFLRQLEIISFTILSVFKYSSCTSALYENKLFEVLIGKQVRPFPGVVQKTEEWPSYYKFTALSVKRIMITNEIYVSVL